MGLGWLSFPLVIGYIFLFLCMSSNFGLYSGHFKYKNLRFWVLSFSSGKCLFLSFQQAVTLVGFRLPVQCCLFGVMFPILVQFSRPLQCCFGYVMSLQISGVSLRLVSFVHRVRGTPLPALSSIFLSCSLAPRGPRRSFSRSFSCLCCHCIVACNLGYFWSKVNRITEFPAVLFR